MMRSLLLLLITANCARKSVGKPVGKPLTDLGCKPLPDGASKCLTLLGRKLGKPVGNPVCEPLPQLVRDPLPNDAANHGPLLRRELGKSVRKSFADLARHSFTCDTGSKVLSNPGRDPVGKPIGKP